MSDQVPTTPTVTAVAASPRIALRDKILSKKVARLPATFQGEAIEIIQPSIGAIIDMKDEVNGDDQKMVMKSLISYAVVPGTNETIFEDTDYDSLMALPFTSELKDIMDCITKSSGLDKLKEGEVKN